MARDITRDIKYVDTHIEILLKLDRVAEDVGLELDKYDESKVLELKNELESAIYSKKKKTRRTRPRRNLISKTKLKNPRIRGRLMFTRKRGFLHNPSLNVI